MTTLHDILIALGEDPTLRGRVQTHPHPEPGRDDALVTIEAVIARRPDAPAVLVHTVVQPGPSSAQGYADGIADAIQAITGFDVARTDHLDDDMTDDRRAVLRGLLEG